MLASLGQQQQYKLVLALKNKDAYPHEVYLPEIKVLETLCFIFLCAIRHLSEPCVSLFCAKNETDIQKRRSWIKQSQCFLELAESYQLENA
jgi:hypothetical protein